MSWAYATQLSELLAESGAKGRSILPDLFRPILWAWVSVANFESQVSSKTLSCLISWPRCKMHCFCSPLSFPWFSSSINPISLLKDLLSNFLTKIVMRVQMKMCPWLVGRGSFIITSSKLSCFSFNNTDCYKWSASWNRSPTHKTTTISILIYFYPIICSSHIFKNRAMVTYVQVCLILCHTFYTYFLVLNISPYCNIVGCTNF